MLAVAWAPERARGRRRSSEHERDPGKLERLLRCVQPRGRRRGCRTDLARLLPVGKQRRELHQLARPRLPRRPVSVPRAFTGSHGQRRRSRDRVGRAGPRLRRVGELGRPSGIAQDLRRRFRRTLRQQRRPHRRPAKRREALPRHHRRCSRLVSALPAREVQ